MKMIKNKNLILTTKFVESHKLQSNEYSFEV